MRMDSPWPRTPRNRLFALVLVCTLVPGIGVADYWSGYDTTFAAFYLVPVVVASWYIGRRPGMAVAVLCVCSGLVADYFLPGRLSDHLGVEVWNAASQLLIDGFAIWLMTALQSMLEARAKLIRDLETALGEIRTLRGLLPICAWCKRIRDEQDGATWKSVECYVAEHTEAEFTHGICPECAAKVVGDMRKGPPSGGA